MKRKGFFLLALALIAAALLLTGNHGGDVRNVSREVGQSEIYTSGEIEAAMAIAQEHFRAEFDGCRLQTLSYDETHSVKFSQDWAAQYDAQEAIVLLSCFTVDSSGGDGSFTPNGTYGNWQWILTRSNGEGWVLRTWGYG